MKWSTFSEEQIAYAQRQADGGTPVADACRQPGVSAAAFYVWINRYGKLRVSEFRQTSRLRDEMARLKRSVVDRRNASFLVLCPTEYPFLDRFDLHGHVA
jgi:putative transposase